MMNFYVLSKLLKQTHSLLWSGYLALLICLYFLLHTAMTSIVVHVILIALITLSLLHHYISFRVQFDADLLDQFSQTQHDQPENIEQMTQALDQSLMYFKLMSADKVGRDWATRFRGCLKLFKIQILLVILQWISVILLFQYV